MVSEEIRDYKLELLIIIRNCVSREAAVDYCPIDRVHATQDKQASQSRTKNVGILLLLLLQPWEVLQHWGENGVTFWSKHLVWLCIFSFG